MSEQSPRFRWVVFAAAASPALFHLLAVLKFGVDMPYLDQWEPSLAGLYIKAHDNTLGLADFFTLHNEHQIVVPRVLAYALNRLTGWNTVGEMLLEWLLVAATSGMILRLARQTIGRGRLSGETLGLWFLANLMLFTPMQMENWLWGMGVVNVMPMLFISAALVVAGSGIRAWMRWMGAMLLVILGTFSLGNGILGFVLVGIALAWSVSFRELAEKKWMLAAWAGGFVLCLVLLMIPGSEPARPPGASAGFIGVWPSLVYVVRFLGTQFAIAVNVDPALAAGTFGTILLTLYVAGLGYFLWLRMQLRETQTCRSMLVWLLIGAFAIASAGLGAVYRSNLGLMNAMSSRYVTFALWLPLSLVFLVPLVCADLRGRITDGSGLVSRLCGHLPVVLGSVLVTLHVASLYPTWAIMEQGHRNRLRAKAALALIELFPDNPQLTAGVYPDVSRLRSAARRLSELGYLRPRQVESANVRKIELARGPNPTRAGVLEQLVRTGEDQAVAQGWALWPITAEPPAAVLLTYLNEQSEPTIFAITHETMARPDLAQAQGDDRLAGSGWRAVLPISRLPQSPPTLVIGAWAFDAQTGRAVELDRTITVNR